eukprot:4307321-Amphidinium_carterae.1
MPTWTKAKPISQNKRKSISDAPLQVVLQEQPHHATTADAANLRLSDTLFVCTLAREQSAHLHS